MEENANKSTIRPAVATVFIGALLCIVGFLLAVNSGKEPSPQQTLYAIMFYGGAAIGIAGALWVVAWIIGANRSQR